MQRRTTINFLVLIFYNSNRGANYLDNFSKVNGATLVYYI